MAAETKPIQGDHDNKKAAHVLVVSLATQGHIAPLLRLATQLARHDITVTFVATEDAFSRLTANDPDFSAELQRLDFRFVAQRPDDGQSLGRGSLHLARKSRADFTPVLEKLNRDRSAGIPGPTSIISDMFLPWTQDIANEFQIPRYMFVTSGITFARFMQGCFEYYESGRVQFSATDGKLLEFDWPICIPGLPSLRFYELPQGFREGGTFFRTVCASLWQSAGVLVNSFFELEEKVVETWKSSEQPGFQQMKVPKLYPVGPLFSRTFLQTTGNSLGLEDSASQCLPWLGSQPSSSVLYVAFGSETRLHPQQIQELAHGLEDSKQRFLWVIPQSKATSGKEAPSLTEVLPPGFEARVGDRGCIVTGWAPQLQILAHSSTGCFLTHSGWNSSLESIIMGVPMISWPQRAEQHLNCRYLAEDVKVAEQLQTGAENVLKRDEVVRAVRLLMVEEEGKAIKRRVEELQRKAIAAMAAVTDDGSQSCGFLEFLQDVHHDVLSLSSAGN